MLSNEKQKELLNTRVQYTRTGSRKGWYGTIVAVSASRVCILYDNGVEQDYQANAVSGVVENPYNRDCVGYLVRQRTGEEVPQESNSIQAILKDDVCIIVNRRSLRIVGTAQDLNEAADFAAEQVADNPDDSFIVYEPCALVKKQPTPIYKRMLGSLASKSTGEKHVKK